MNTQTPDFTNPNSPFYIDSKVRAYRELADLPNTLMQGEDALRAKGETYLVKRDKIESDDLFQNRLNVSNLVNAFQIGVSGWAGRITGQGIDISEEASEIEIVSEIKEKADRIGNNLDVFAGQVAKLGLGTGSGIILVDGPQKSDENVSQREAKEAGLRPYFRLINQFTELLGYSASNGVLLQFRVLEVEEVSNENSYQKDIVYKSRVYKLEGEKVTCTVYEFKSNNAVELSSTILPLSYIPVVAYNPGEQGDLILGDTPVRELANLTKAHWNSWSLQTWILLAARTPFLTVIGAGKGFSEKIKTSISTFLNISKGKSEADVKYTEINGQGPEAGFKHVSVIEAAIRQYGIEVTRPSGNDLATTKIIDTEKTMADLKGWAEDLESVVSNALSIACDFTNAVFPEGGATVNKEFGYNAISSEQVQLIKILTDSGRLPAKVVYEYIVRPNFKTLKDVPWEDVEEMMLSEDRAGDTDITDLFGADNK